MLERLKYSFIAEVSAFCDQVEIILLAREYFAPKLKRKLPQIEICSCKNSPLAKNEAAWK